MEEATIKQIFGKVKPIVDLHEKIIIELEDLIDNFEEKGRNIAEVCMHEDTGAVILLIGLTMLCSCCSRFGKTPHTSFFVYIHLTRTTAIPRGPYLSLPAREVQSSKYL